MSPRPWRVAANNPTIVLDANGVGVADCFAETPDKTREESWAISVANAKAVVDAVNELNERD